MDGLRISELARSAGVPTSTVRYYERIGLVPGPARTDSGYRIYDTEAATRLLFIARAKRLGLTLEAIAELSAIWDGTNCGATRTRLAALLDAKRVEIADQVRELEAFSEQLADVQRRLAAQDAPAECASDLVCCTPGLVEAAPITMSRRSARGDGSEPVVVACSMETCGPS